MPDLLATGAIAKFPCLGDKCSDTCCKGWSMQMDDATLKRYQKDAPELIAAVERSAESPWIMRKDAAGVCVKLEDGLCGIHRVYGSAFLGDACYFYPRVTRALGDQLVMTGTLSCPEIARLMLEHASPCALEDMAVDRVPQTVKNYLPESLSPADGLEVHQAFIKAASDEAVSAGQAFLRIASASRSLEMIDKNSWPKASAFYLMNADKRIPAAEKNPADPFNLLHALCGLIVASKKKPSERLLQTIHDMEQALLCRLDWENVQIHTTPQSADAYVQLQALWQSEAAPIYTPVLRRWLQMQLSVSLFPFSGLGNNLPERVSIIGVRMATLKLALLCSHANHKEALPQDAVVRIIQSISRILDHLGDPVFSLQIYAETGWTREHRMRGLLEI